LDFGRRFISRAEYADVDATVSNAILEQRGARGRVERRRKVGVSDLVVEKRFLVWVQIDEIGAHDKQPGVEIGIYASDRCAGKTKLDAELT
jgi:hypothetical protein